MEAIAFEREMEIKRLAEEAENYRLKTLREAENEKLRLMEGEVLERELKVYQNSAKKASKVSYFEEPL